MPKGGIIDPSSPPLQENNCPGEGLQTTLFEKHFYPPRFLQCQNVDVIVSILYMQLLFVIFDYVTSYLGI